MTKIDFENFLKIAKYQFVLKTKKYIYFIPIAKESHYSDECFIAFNETTGEVDIVNFKDVISVIVDGKETKY